MKKQFTQKYHLENKISCTRKYPFSEKESSEGEQRHKNETYGKQKTSVTHKCNHIDNVECESDKFNQ